MREAKIKSLFDNELKDLWYQKENSQKEVNLKDVLLTKLVDVVKR
jgi:hypothetical protein